MTLTIALSILGGVVLVAVLAHGWWTARRASPRQPQRDLPRGEPREPVFADASAALPAADAAAAEPKAGLPETKPRRTTPRLDPLIDAIVPIALEQPISGDVAMAHLPPTRRAGSKPFIIEGLNAADGEWELPVPAASYSEFQAGVLMANRSGAINEIEYSEFVQKIQAFADGIGATAEPPDMLDVVSRAKELDAFASGHDAQIAVHLRAQASAWSVGYLLQLAARRGFIPGVVPGRLVLPNGEDGAPPVLTLSFDPQAALADDPAHAVVSDATLALDVPQTAGDAEPFATWQQAGRDLAGDLDASVVDDHGVPISLHGFTAIGDELQVLYAALEKRGLAAGSPAARRLFS